MTTRTTTTGTTLSIVEPVTTEETTVLDDLLGDAWFQAQQNVTANVRHTPHRNDRWRGPIEQVHTFVTTHPHF